MGWSAAGPFYSSDVHAEDLGMSLRSQIFKDTNAMPRTQDASFLGFTGFLWAPAGILFGSIYPI